MTKQLCHNCNYLKSRNVGFVSTVFWCGLVGDGYSGTSIGVQPWIKRPHPKCPLQNKVEVQHGEND
mgnify:CR=1 FL=1